jgi:hypothetical protein
MNCIYKSQYFELFHDQENAIFESRWLNSRQITAYIFMQEMQQYVRLVQAYLPARYLVDNHDNEFVINVELQDWVNENVFPHTMHKGVKKFALVVTDELFAQTSLEQTIDTGEKNIGAIPTRYFPNREEAYHWLVA